MLTIFVVTIALYYEYGQLKENGTERAFDKVA